MTLKAKKGAMTLSDLAPVAIAFVFVAVVIGVGATVLSSIRGGQGYGTTTACGTNSTGGSSGTILYTGCSTAANTTGEGLNSLDELGGWLPTIALVVAAAIVIGVLSFFRS